LKIGSQKNKNKADNNGRHTHIRTRRIRGINQKLQGKTATIRAVQGEVATDAAGNQIARTNLVALREFESRTGKKAPNYLFDELKAQASSSGYKTIRLIKPEFMVNYKNPFFLDAWIKRLIAQERKMPEQTAESRAAAQEEIKKQIQQKIKALYYGLAESEKLEDKGIYWETQL